MKSNFLSPLPCYPVVENYGNRTAPSHRQSSSGRERRDRSQPIPVNLSSYLNEDQSLSLRQMGLFGWQLAFVRRPMFQDPVFFVVNEDKSLYGLLEKDGYINTTAAIAVRESPEGV